MLLISIALLLPHYLVALPWQVEDDRIAALSVRARRHVRAARLQISNDDRKSGERRSARLKCRTLRRDKNEIEIAKMLDGS